MQVFRVQGMTCGHCERAVIEAIRALDPQAEIRVDRSAGVVEVKSPVPSEQLRQAIQEEGYSVH